MTTDRAFLNLNSCYGSQDHRSCNASFSSPNIWENPAVTGIHRLPPHSRNVSKMADAYGQKKQEAHIPPCVCLDSSCIQDSHHDVSSVKGWQFRLFANPHCIPIDYVLPLTNDSSNSSEELIFCRNEVSIPHNWTMMPCHRKKLDIHSNSIQDCGCELSDPPRYTNVRMPFATLYPHVPVENPTGVYRLEFTMNNAWKESKMIILHLGAVESCFFVYINGLFVGMGKDSRLPSEFDVTSFLDLSTTTNNILTIVALKWSDGSFLEQQDHWRGMGGIHRSVYLYALPKESYIEDVFCRATVVTRVETSHSIASSVFPLKWKGKVQVNARVGRRFTTRVEGRDVYYNENIRCVRTDATDKSGVEYRMKFQLYDRQGIALFDKPLDVTDTNCNYFSEAHSRSNLMSFSADVPGCVEAWSDETPTLYSLEATLYQVVTTNEDETLLPVDTYHTNIGFRTIEITNRQLLINGQPVLIKGVNRHDHSSTGGKCVTRSDIFKDLTLMKAYNFNAIRTAHYPNDPYLYDLADEMGLYVIDEANIECHGHYDMICREPTYTSAMFDRVQRMVVRDQNHPCIIGFSIGNEAGFSMSHKMLYGWIKGYDDSRFVQYEGANRPKWGQFPHVFDRSDSVHGTDVICPMYASVDEMIEWADVIAPRLKEQRPMILCEYAHAMGNSSGSLSDYWEVIKSKHGLSGGFIWDWIDQGIQEIDEKGNVWFAYGGDYGETEAKKTHDANFNINGMISPDRAIHPAMFEHKKLCQHVDFDLELGEQDPIIIVHNRRYFSSLSDVKISWRLRVDGFVCDEGSYFLPEVYPQDNFTTSMKSLSQSMIKHKINNLPEGAEVHLDVHAGCSKQGSEIIGVEQFTIRKDKVNLLQNFAAYKSARDYLTEPGLSESENGLLINTKGYELELSRDAKLKYNGKTNGTTVLMEGLRLNLFRAGTDNDGVKQFADQFHDELKPLGKWLAIGLDSLDFDEFNICPKEVSIPNTESDCISHSGIVASARIMGRPCHSEYKGIALAECVLATDPIPLGFFEQTISMLGDGSLYIDVQINLNESLRDLPRVGLEISIPEKFKDIFYYANGPHENYSDRKFSAHAGVYQETVSDSPSTYVVPQEQGNRTGLRWLFASEQHKQSEHESTPHTIEQVLKDKTGLLIVPLVKDYQFTVSRFTDAQLFAARHTNEIPPSSSLYIRLDAAQRGLGSGSCGPQTLSKYQLDGGTYRIAFWMKSVG